MTEPQTAGAPPAPEVPEEPVGTTLRMAREAAGLGLEEAARRLKFAPRQLDALERGEWGRLPGGAAVRGMVRQYASLLGLDADTLVARAGEGTPLDQLAQRFQQPIPFSESSRRSNAAYVVLSLVLLGVVGGVAYQWRQERASEERMSFVAATQQPAEPARAEPVRPAAEPPAPAPATTAKPAPAAPQAAAAVAPPAPAAPPPAREPTGPPGRIVLRFEEESWVEIYSATGKLLVSHLHPAGSEREVTGLPPFSIVIGNAQHVTLTYNGEPVDLTPHIKVEVARFTLE